MTIEGTFEVEPLGETVLLLRFGRDIDAALNARVHAAAALLLATDLPGVRDFVPAYATLALYYEPAVWEAGGAPPWRQLADAVRAVFAAPPLPAGTTPARIEIPVCYGGDAGPDLARVAAHCGLAADEVVARHCAGTYRVAMIGFAPGFPYLIGLDPALAVPRRDAPRLRVPAGSVAIGGAQAGIYPSELPGGWQLVGRTPLRLFDASRDPPALLAPGDEVRFVAIDAQRFAALGESSR